MRETPTRRFIPGTFKRECDVCGLDFLRHELKKRWDGALVCAADYEEKDRQFEKRYHRERSFQKE